MNISTTDDVNIVIDEDYNKKYNKSIIIIQKFIRRKYCINKYNKFKERIRRVTHCKDTTRINSSKFKLPLYLVQQPFFKKIFGNKKWDKINYYMENTCFLWILCMIHFISTCISGFYIFNVFISYNLNLISVFFCLPLYLFYYFSLEDQLTILIFSGLSCKLYVIMSFLCIFGLTDLFRDSRIINVWLNLFPGLLLTVFSDAIPRYMKKTRKIFGIIASTYVIYCYMIIFGTTFGFIKINPREIITDSQINNKKIVTFSSVSYTLSFLNTLVVLLIKNLFWHTYNNHRAVILKSPILLSSMLECKQPKIKRKNLLTNRKKFFIEKKIKLNNDTHINHIKLKPSFALFNTY
jgi:hypothetical protein